MKEEIIIGIIVIIIAGILLYFPLMDTKEHRYNIKNDYIISTEDCIILECRRATWGQRDRLLIECNNTKEIIKVNNMLDYYVGQQLTKSTWNYKGIRYK